MRRLRTGEACLTPTVSPFANSTCRENAICLPPVRARSRNSSTAKESGGAQSGNNRRTPMLTRKLSRRSFLASTAAASIGITAPHVRGAHAAGKLAMGFWDHWVPGANSATTALVKEWAEKEKVDIAIDYIPPQGNKLLITITAEAQARAGHDILAFPSWQPADHALRLDPVDDIMAHLISENGAVNPTA